MELEQGTTTNLQPTAEQLVPNHAETSPLVESALAKITPEQIKQVNEAISLVKHQEPDPTQPTPLFTQVKLQKAA